MYMYYTYKGRSPEKKTAVLLDFVQITSPPPTNLDNFVSDIKIQDLKVSLGLKILLLLKYTIYTT